MALSLSQPSSDAPPLNKHSYRGLYHLNADDGQQPNEQCYKRTIFQKSLKSRKIRHSIARPQASAFHSAFGLLSS
jgi:hypothetical protein